VDRRSELEFLAARGCGHRDHPRDNRTQSRSYYEVESAECLAAVCGRPLDKGFPFLSGISMRGLVQRHILDLQHRS